MNKNKTAGESSSSAVALFRFGGGRKSQVVCNASFFAVLPPCFVFRLFAVKLYFKRENAK